MPRPKDIVYDGEQIPAHKSSGKWAYSPTTYHMRSSPLPGGFRNWRNAPGAHVPVPHKPDPVRYAHPQNQFAPVRRAMMPTPPSQQAAVPGKTKQSAVDADEQAGLLKLPAQTALSIVGRRPGLKLPSATLSWLIKREDPELARLAPAEAARRLGAERPMKKMASVSSSVAKLVPAPILSATRPYTGRWTIAGSGRLRIPKRSSDIDYMTPLEDMRGFRRGLKEMTSAPGAFWRDLAPVGTRPASVVSVPEVAYKMIDDSYVAATRAYKRGDLRRMKREMDKIDFYRKIGVVFTSDAMAKVRALSGKTKTASSGARIVPLSPRRFLRVKVAAAEHEGHGTGIPTMQPWFKPYPHQQRAIQKLYDNHGKMLLFHDTGTGKSATSVYGFEKMSHDKKSNGRAVVVVPSGLRENYAGSAAGKFTVGRTIQIVGSPDEVRNDPKRYVRSGGETGANYTVISYDMFRRDPVGVMRRTGADTLILDEHHRARNELTKTFKAVMAARPYAKNFMGLTASPVNNSPAEVASLVTMSEGRRIVSPQQFRKVFERTVGTEPGFRGGKKEVKDLVNMPLLVSMLYPRTDTVATEDLEGKTMPKKVIQEVQVPMSERQYKLYKMALGEAGILEGFLMRRDDNITLKEAEQLFVKLHQARRVANSVHTARKDLDPKAGATQTPKVKTLLEDTEAHLAEDPKNQVVLYSNLVRGGVDVLSAGLEARGIDHAIFTGKDTEIGGKKITGITRQRGVDEYRAGKKRAIIISGAGAEGLDLPDTTAFFALDGHFNPERISQAEARGVRLGGQSHRAPEDRKVLIRRYQSVVPDDARPGFFGRLFGRKTPKTTDQWMYSVAKSKERQATKLETALRRPHKYIRKYQTAGGEWRYVYDKSAPTNQLAPKELAPKKEPWWRRVAG